MQNEQEGRGTPGASILGLYWGYVFAGWCGMERKDPPDGCRGGWIGWLGGGGSDRGLFLVLLGGVAVVVLSGFGGVAS